MSGQTHLADSLGFSLMGGYGGALVAAADPGSWSMTSAVGLHAQRHRHRRAGSDRRRAGSPCGGGRTAGSRDRVTLAAWRSSLSRPTGRVARRRHRSRGTSRSTARSRSARARIVLAGDAAEIVKADVREALEGVGVPALRDLVAKAEPRRRTDPRLKGVRGGPWGDRRRPHRSRRRVVDAAGRRPVDRCRRPVVTIWREALPTTRRPWRRCHSVLRWHSRTTSSRRSRSTAGRPAHTGGVAAVGPDGPGARRLRPAGGLRGRRRGTASTSGAARPHRSRRRRPRRRRRPPPRKPFPVVRQVRRRHPADPLRPSDSGAAHGRGDPLHRPQRRADRRRRRGTVAEGAVLVIHENRGLTQHIRSIPPRLAADGCTALAIDLLSEEGGTASMPSRATPPRRSATRPPTA